MRAVNRVRNGMLLLGAVAFLGSLVLGAIMLPDRVASHFGFQGEADGWMSKEADLIILAAVGLGLPLFIVGLTYVTRFFPDSTFNLPHKDYWLAPERREETVNYIFRHSLWVAGMMQIFLSWLNFLGIVANRQPSPRLPMLTIWMSLAVLVIALIFWMIQLVKHFNRPA